MKIIDLLNKIANGEVVPKIIKYKNEIRYYVDSDKDYMSHDSKYYYLFYNIFKEGAGEHFQKALNYEVEIIEEEKKISEKLDHLIGYDIQQFDDLKEYVEITTNDLFGKVNKIIDTLNQVIDYLESKETGE